MTELNEGSYVEPAKMNFGQFMLSWLEVKKGDLTRLTCDSYHSYITKHINPSIGDIPLSKLTAHHIQQFVSDLRSKTLEKKGKPFSEATIQRMFNIVITALNYAKKMGLVRENVALVVDKPKIRKKKLKVWNVDEVNTFLKALEGHRHYLAYYLAIHTGMRQGEILGLPWSNVDLDKKIIRVTQTLEHDAKNIKQGAKSQSGNRSISISDEVVAQLKKQLKMIENEKNDAGISYDDNDLAICTNIGKPVFPDTVTKIMRRIIKQTGLRPITFHDLRHTSASLMLMLGIHPKVVSERLGHSSINMTLDTYSHLLPNMQMKQHKN